MPKLPHEPQPLVQMQRRFAAAVAKYIDLEAVLDGTKLRPGELRTHVFDFVDGLRLIISREDLGGPAGKIIHVSASIDAGSPLWRLAEEQIFRGGTASAMELLMHEAKYKFRVLSGRDVTLRLDHVSPDMGVPHWFCKVDEWEAAEKLPA